MRTLDMLLQRSTRGSAQPRKARPAGGATTPRTARKAFRPLVELLERRELLSSTPNQLYVAQAYRDALAPEADTPGIAYWSGPLPQNLPRGPFARGLTPHYRKHPN